MIITALKLQEATKEAVHNDMTMEVASELFANRNVLSDEEFTRALYEYSALLASITTTLATSILLTEEQMDAMIDEIKEFDQLGKDALNGNSDN